MQGIADSQNNLGLMYAKGNGVAENDALAVKWFRKAAEQGYGHAQNNLGAMYANGQGVQRDSVMALLWWNLARAQGFTEMNERRFKFSQQMSAEEIASAQRLASEWQAMHREE